MAVRRRRYPRFVSLKELLTHWNVDDVEVGRHAVHRA